ncbi:MAG: serine protease, partial [Gemmobacter sp.]
MHRLIASAAMIAVLLAAAPARPEAAVPSSMAEIGLSFAPVVKAAAPAVVNIFARTLVPARRSLFADDPVFGPLFRDFGPAQPRAQNS